jgi:hypothetical protein
MFSIILGIAIFDSSEIFNHSETYLIIGILSIVKLISAQRAHIDVDPRSYGLLIPILLIMKIEDNQTAFEFNNNLIPIVGIIYLLWMFIPLLSQKELKHNRFITLMILSTTFLLAFMESNGTGSFIPLEFFMIAILSVISFFRHEENLEELSEVLFIVSTLFLGILASDIEQIFDHTFKDNLQYNLIKNIGYILFSMFLLFILLRSKNKRSWMNIYVNFVLFESIISVFLDQQVHPIVLAVSILLFLLPLMYQYQEYIRINLPFLQGIAILALAYREYSIDISNLSVSLNFSLFLIWSNLMIYMWYHKGISNQLLSTISAIFAVGGGYAGMQIINMIEIFEPILVFIALIEATVVIFVYNSRTSASQSKDIYRILFASISSMILISISLRNTYSGTELLTYRLILDWLLFIPIFVQTVSYARPIIDQIYSNVNKHKEGDTIVLSIMGLFVLTALVIGAENIYSVKLLALAIVFWVFAAAIIRPILSWTSSLFTIFTFGFILAQFGDGSEGFTEYFLALAFFGVIMTTVGYINEIRYKGEPFTASLMISGSVLTATSVIVPLILGDPFPLVDRDTGLIIINFIPNVVWAIQGLLLFVISLRLSKDYLRRLALSILMVDILKTGYNIVIEGDNPLIRIVGAIVLGGVLILIFYLFTKESEEIPTVEAK